MKDRIAITTKLARGKTSILKDSNSSPNQYLDKDGKPVLNIQLNGTPANQQGIENIVDQTGANLIYIKNNNADFVGNTLGRNNGNLEQLISTMPGSILLFTKTSPHSNYYCTGSNCNFNNNLNQNK